MSDPEDTILDMSILIVDDIKDNLDLVQAILADEGFLRTRPAWSAREALLILEAEPVDLILLDVMMADVDGITACKQIKRNSKLKDIPIIIITSRLDNATLKQCFDCGANDYIRKPVNEVELLARVKTALKAKRESDIQKEREKAILIASMTDPLTQVYNRRSMSMFFKREMERAKRERKHLSFLLCDLDFFKLYNDTYGHPAGDEALKKVALTLRESFRRPGDLVFRMGGEEFGVLFGDLDWDKSFEYADKVRKSVEGLRIEHSLAEPAGVVTVSMGLYIMYDDPGIEEADMIKRADDALYRAKSKGRNKVVLWTPWWSV